MGTSGGSAGGTSITTTAQRGEREPVKDVKVDVSWDRSRYFSDSYSDLARNFPGYRVVVHIPFEGDAGVFSLRPSSFNFNPPGGRLGTATSS